ncbi:peptidase S13 [Thiorhodococcus mannitoliphagus]|uniref:Peptidase S13 n=1 Tax=Thiorhodococcus mannitoliphagus TaxID=329406 RepID=A0A6P1DZ87_9GAMM|nr:D-alanyl-D-alanine carboxypeptidase [Thiorhodococcus mannitoliphagus]NEX22999.1 peptidase S13 [Thiorhodococcus mannitoliphagus]
MKRPALRHGLSPYWRYGLTLLIVFALFRPALAGADPVAQVKGLGKASLLLKDGGSDLIAYQAEVPRVPASTMKLLTAFAALETWGPSYRFETEFFQDRSGWLWVKGYADPYLVSEELDRIVRALKKAGIRQVAGIGLDDSFFSPEVEIAGRSSSDNPYDAPVTALAANFNTINLVRSGASVRSAETQTELTPTARRFGLAGSNGKQRVNLRERPIALRYFGELLAAKLKGAGIAVSDEQKNAPVPANARLVYRHANSRTLSEMLSPMLKYSNNFIANALFLRLAQPDGRGRVSMTAAQKAMTSFARRRFGWRDFRIDDGAGLSRANRLTARQLVELVEAFSPYRELLAAQDGDPRVRAKTGTLRGVSCYAGFVKRNGRWAPFALLINQPVEYNLRRRVASSLAR